jgi:hypothetical protein
MLSPHNLVAEFPFFRLAVRQPFNAVGNVLPPGYFLELIGGAVSLSPIIVLAPIILFRRRLWTAHRAVLGVLAAMSLCAAGCILFVALIPVASQRFEADFLPGLLLVSCVAGAALWGSLRRNGVRIVAAVVLSGLLLYCIASNLALAIQGPYDQFVQASPGAYVHLARWFSPVEQDRPVLNPSLQAQAVFQFRPGCPIGLEPLFTAGEFGSRYVLSAICNGPGTIRLVSQSSVRHPDIRWVDLPFSAPWRYTAGLSFTPQNLLMTITWNGRIVLRHPLRFLVTSRSQVRFGLDPSVGNLYKFEGTVIPSAPPILQMPEAR